MEQAPILSQSNFEKLLDKLNEERKIAEELKKKNELEDINSFLNRDRRRNLVKSIISVFYFLRCQLHMPYREISLEEFETVELELRKIANEAGFVERYLKGWNFYLKNGYFRRKRTPFGKWDCAHRDWQDNFDFFNPNDLISYPDCSAIPPNIRGLLDELFEKRYKK